MNSIKEIFKSTSSVGDYKKFTITQLKAIYYLIMRNGLSIVYNRHSNQIAITPENSLQYMSSYDINYYRSRYNTRYGISSRTREQLIEEIKLSGRLTFV